jgi:ABC-type transport system substrate-binding protein
MTPANVGTICQILRRTYASMLGRDCTGGRRARQVGVEARPHESTGPAAVEQAEGVAIRIAAVATMRLPASYCAVARRRWRDRIDSERRNGATVSSAPVLMLMRHFSFAFAAMLVLAASTVATAQGTKVLRYALTTPIAGFDPASVGDVPTIATISQLFDAPYNYDYLARPARVRPNTAAALPEISTDGRVLTIRLRPGIYFADDPAFNGKKRELTAADYAYSLKRHWDPKIKSPSLYLVSARIKGMAALRAEAENSGRFDYDRPVAGLTVPDRYTLRIELNEPAPNFTYFLTLCPLACAVAREVVEAYGDKLAEHPVGTNAFRLTQYARSSRMVFERNANFREQFYDARAPEEDLDGKAIAAKLAGRRLPMLDRVEVYIVEEAQPRWLAFLNAEHDLIEVVPPEFVSSSIPAGRLSASLTRRGVRMHRIPTMSVFFAYFGMNDPVVGGYTPEKIALRRAIALAYDVGADIRVIRRGQAIAAQTVLPPGAVGFDPGFRSPLAVHDPARARALLDTYGYVDRDGDGWRELPDGRPLRLMMASRSDQLSRQLDELWKKSMDDVGIRIDFRKGKFQELIRDSRAGKLMMFHSGWAGPMPDGEYFMGILYGPNAGQANQSRFNLPQFNRLFAQASQRPEGAERERLYLEMNRLLAAYAPLRPTITPIDTALMHPWVTGFRRHPVMREFWKYIDIDAAAQAASR